MLPTSTFTLCKKSLSIEYLYKGNFCVGLRITPGMSKCSASANVSLIQVSMTRAFRTLPVFFMVMISSTLFWNAFLSAYSFSPIHLALEMPVLVFLPAPIRGWCSESSPVRPSARTAEVLAGELCRLFEFPAAWFIRVRLLAAL